MRLNTTDFANLLVTIGNGVKHFANSLVFTSEDCSARKSVSKRGDLKSTRSRLWERFLLNYYGFYLIIILWSLVLLNLHEWQLFLFIFLVAEFAFIIISAYKPGLAIGLRIAFGAAYSFIALLNEFTSAIPGDIACNIFKFLHIDWFVKTRLLAFELFCFTQWLTYWLFYFSVFFAPYLAVSILILAPMLSCIYAFFFGFLIGYILIGYVSSFLIFCSFLSAVYIVLIFPIVKVEFFSPARHWNKSEYFISNAWFERPDPELAKVIDLSESLNIHLDYGSFINSAFIRSNFEFCVDSLAGIMVLTITFISFVVHLYSIHYMRNDPHTVRFFGLLGLFTFFMLMLVTSTDFVMLYIGWEGVGLSSYLLISFWYTRVQAQKSAVKAMLMNKFGDIFLLFAISIITYYTRGDMNFYTIQEPAYNKAIIEGQWWGFSSVDVACLALVLAAFVKSAQLIFHTWLPDAMEGPTPVSALLHAATMVTAGVYLVIRFSFIIEFSAASRLLMLVVSVWTILTSSLIALCQYDIKKIIAYSTCGQLGIMFLGCSLSGYDFALYHFFNHAFFKCLLFLLAGVIIHELRGEQDIRGMGRLSEIMPYTFLFFVIGTLSLVGFPSFSGASSKDLIIALVDDRISDLWLKALSEDSSYIFHVFYFIKVRFILIFLTSAYMIRLIYYTFFCFPNYRSNRFLPGYTDVSFTNKSYLRVFSVLSLFSVFGGRCFKNFFVFTDGYYVNIHNDILIIHADTSSIAIFNSGAYITHALLILILTFTAILFAFLRKNGHIYPFHTFMLRDLNFVRALFPNFYYNKLDSLLRLLIEEFFKVHFVRVKDVHLFFNKRCYFDDVYNLYISRPCLRLSVILKTSVERGVFLRLARRCSQLFIIIKNAPFNVSKVSLFSNLCQVVLTSVFTLFFYSLFLL